MFIVQAIVLDLGSLFKTGVIVSKDSKISTQEATDPTKNQHPIFQSRSVMMGGAVVFPIETVVGFI